MILILKYKYVSLSRLQKKKKKATKIFLNILRHVMQLEITFDFFIMVCHFGIWSRPFHPQSLSVLILASEHNEVKGDVKISRYSFLCFYTASVFERERLGRS